MKRYRTLWKHHVVLSVILLSIIIITSIFSFSRTSFAGINDNLVSYWKFNEGTPDTCTGSEDVCDSAGALDGERSGASGANNLPQWSTEVPTIAAANPYSMQFDGTDDQVTGIGDVNFTGNAFSAAVWINPSAWGVSGDAYIHNILCDEGGSSTFCFRLGSKGLSSLKQRIAVMIYSGGSNDYEAASDLSLNSWQHVAVTFDGSNVRFYINGVLDRTQSAPITMNNGSGGFRMGASPASERFYQGYMDELRIYDRAITATEISELAAVSPGVATLSPANSATGVGVNDNLIITFDRNIFAVATKNITLKKASDNTTVETILATNTDRVSISGPAATINPSSALSANTTYYVLIDAAAFEDTTGNDYSGISESTTWRFTTAAAVSSVPEFSDVAYMVTLALGGYYMVSRMGNSSRFRV